MKFFTCLGVKSISWGGDRGLRDHHCLSSYRTTRPRLDKPGTCIDYVMCVKNTTGPEGERKMRLATEHVAIKEGNAANAVGTKHIGGTDHLALCFAAV